MKIDFLTLMVVAVANLFVMSVMLPFIMGRRVSAAARCAQAGLLFQMLSWAALIASGYWFDGVLSTVSMTCLLYTSDAADE